jgi:hypothetical protein
MVVTVVNVLVVRVLLVAGAVVGRVVDAAVVESVLHFRLKLPVPLWYRGEGQVLKQRPSKRYLA